MPFITAVSIRGTERTRRLIGNVVRDFHAKRPRFISHIDYNISVGKSDELLTDEQNGEFRNVSILYLQDGVDAIIGNKTGNIIVSRNQEQKSLKQIKKQIYAFLQKIQPQNLATAEKISNESHFIPRKGLLWFLNDHSNVTQQFSLKGRVVEKSITGDNNIGMVEIIKDYMTL